MTDRSGTNDSKDDAARPVILVVDDDESIVELILATLRSAPHRIVTASDGAEAVQIAREVHPAVILLDVAMPGISGFETCQRLKADPTTRDAFIVMLTARSQPEDRARAIEVGANGYISKPFRPSELLATIGKQLGW
ncbi:MAG: response regulator [Chloroflexota bacterium]|nr:MAG: response regulator [Chloroflexota bacterium]